MLDDELDGLGVGVLRDVLVLHETLLGGPATSKLDAELDETDHDRLEGGQRGLLEPPGGEDLIEGGESGLRLADIDELLRALENSLGLGEGRHDGQSSLGGWC